MASCLALHLHTLRAPLHNLHTETPASLTKLLSRLDVANRLATERYGLSGSELAELVEEPLSRLELRSDPWVWRDWLVEPLPDGRWRLRRGGKD